MPPCKNDPSARYNGTEPSPKGLGKCAHAAPVGKPERGRDGALWMNTRDASGRLAWRRMAKCARKLEGTVTLRKRGPATRITWTVPAKTVLKASLNRTVVVKKIVVCMHRWDDGEADMCEMLVYIDQRASGGVRALSLYDNAVVERSLKAFLKSAGLQGTTHVRFSEHSLQSQDGPYMHFDVTSKLFESLQACAILAKAR